MEFSVGSSTKFPSVSSLSSLTSVAGLFEGSNTVAETVLINPPAFIISWFITTYAVKVATSPGLINPYGEPSEDEL